MSTFAASYDTIGWMYRLGTGPSADAGATNELSMRVDLGSSLSVWATLDNRIAEITVAELAPGRIDPATLDALAALLGQAATAELVAAASQQVATAAQHDFLELPDVVTSAAADRQQALLASSVLRRTAATDLDARLAALLPSSPRLLPVPWSATSATRALHVDALRRGSGEVLETTPVVDAGGDLVRGGRVWLPVAGDPPAALDTTRPAQLAWQTVTGELLVRLPMQPGSEGFEPGLWVRVNDHDSGLPVALAPVAPDGDANTLLATTDGTLVGLFVDLGRDATAGAGTADERFLQRIGALIDLALDAVERGDTSLAAVAWQGAADVADQHGEHNLAAELRSRAERAAARAPQATDTSEREQSEASPEAHHPAADRWRRHRRTALVAALAVGLVVAALIWLLSGSSDDGASPLPSTAPSPVTTTPIDSGVSTTDIGASATTVDSTTSSSSSTTTSMPPLVDESRYRHYSPGLSPMQSEKFFLVRLITARVAPGEPLVVDLQFGQNYGEQWNASLEECRSKENKIFGNSPTPDRVQMTADFRIARITDASSLFLGNYRTNLVVPWKQVQASDAPFTVAPIQWQPFDCEERFGGPSPSIEAAWGYVRFFYDLVQVSIPLPSLEPGIYTLVPIFAEGPPTDSSAGIVTFIVE